VEDLLERLYPSERENYPSERGNVNEEVNYPLGIFALFSVTAWNKSGLVSSWTTLAEDSNKYVGA